MIIKKNQRRDIGCQWEGCQSHGDDPMFEVGPKSDYWNWGKKMKLKHMDKENKMNKKIIEQKIIKIFGKNLVSVILFGSYARGCHNENSDIDLIVIVDEYKEHSLSELRKFYLLNFEKRLWKIL